MARNSPTSIITYNQCPRLYYHRFIERKPSVPHIDLIKGTVVHAALQDFFAEQPPILCSNHKEWAVERIRRLFMKKWGAKKGDLDSLDLSEEELNDHYEEAKAMLKHWLQDFFRRVDETGLEFNKAFKILTPLTEQEVYFEKYDIKGFIDVIEDIGGEIRIIDYKTSSKCEISKEHKMQLALYAYLYEKQFGKRPDKVGIFFLRDTLRLISVDQTMIDYAEQLCKEVFEKTQSTDIQDYPQHTGYLCRRLKEHCYCHKFEEENE